MDLRTPWDDMDLQVILRPTRQNIKLSAPGFYFSILPLRIAHNHRENQWNEANGAAGLRVILRECIEYERSVATMMLALEVRVSASAQVIMTSSNTTQALQRPNKVSPPTAPLRPNLHYPLRKRSRSTSPRGKRSSKRISKHAKFEPDSKRPEGNATDKHKREKMFADTKSPSNQTISPPEIQHASSNSSAGSDPVVSIPYLHKRIHTAVDTLHNLVIQAEACENNLDVLRSQTTGSQTTVTVTTLTQSAMSQERLEQELSRTQVQAEKVVAELEELAMAICSAIGVGSVPLAYFKAVDPRRKTMDSYDWQVHWQMSEKGLVMWWLA